MSKILELREKRAKAWEAAKAFLDTERGNDGLLSAEDTETYEKMEKDVLDLGKEIERLERQAAIDAELKDIGLVRYGTEFMPEGRVLIRHLKRQQYLDARSAL